MVGTCSTQFLELFQKSNQSKAALSELWELTKELQQPRERLLKEKCSNLN